MGQTGAVVAIHPLASLVGLDVLREGGNAFDAAVAASAVVSLGEPHMSGIGGSCSATIYHAGSDTCSTIDLFGVARTPVGAPRGLASAEPPGLVAGWVALLDHFGTRKLDRLLRPAIEFARKGVPVSVMLSAVIEAVGKGTGPYAARKGDGFRDPSAAGLFMPRDQPLRPGALLIQKELAATLEAIAREGPTAFYQGGIAQEIVQACAHAGGYITMADLKAVHGDWKPSLHGSYRGSEVHTLNVQSLETLSLLGGFNLAEFGLMTGGHIHSVIECIKVAQADQIAHSGERAFGQAVLLQASHVAQRRAEISPGRAARGLADELTMVVQPAGPPDGTVTAASAHSDTTHLVTADRDGNLVSMTQSLGRHFGSRSIAGGTGILLNDRRAITFPRWVAAAPSVVMDSSGAPYIAVGSPAKSAETVPQMLSHVIDFQLNPQAAVEAPRVQVFKDFRVMMESRLPAETRNELARRGHECVVVGEWASGEGQLGRGQMIVRNAEGLLFTGSDPRGDGAAQAI
jgi:gamma-glutamyltranspeptidase/glutathione hydrolase